MDSAFGKIECKFIIKSSQDYISSIQPSWLEQMRDIQEKGQQYLCVKQLNGYVWTPGIVPLFERLFFYKERGEQRITLKMFVLSLNLCLCLVGINQICIVYMPFLNQNANAEYVVRNYVLVYIHYSLLLFLIVYYLFLDSLMIVALRLSTIFIICCWEQQSPSHSSIPPSELPSPETIELESLDTCLSLKNHPNFDVFGALLLVDCINNGDMLMH